MLAVLGRQREAQQAAEGESERKNVRSNLPQNRRTESVQGSRAASTDGSPGRAEQVWRNGSGQGGTTVHTFVEADQLSFCHAEPGTGAIAFERRCARPDSDICTLEQEATPDARQDLQAALTLISGLAVAR